MYDENEVGIGIKEDVAIPDADNEIIGCVSTRLDGTAYSISVNHGQIVEVPLVVEILR